VGCSSKEASGPPLYPVRGKVLVDGKPADGAIVSLWATNPTVKFDRLPMGYCKSDGTFSVGTTELADGAPAGDYDITVAWLPQNARRIFEETGVAPPSLIAKKFNEPKTSGLKMTVKQEENLIPEWQLSSK